MRSIYGNVRCVVPYTPGEQPNEPGMLKLNTNENPYPPSPQVLEAMRRFDTGSLQLYPDPTAGACESAGKSIRAQSLRGVCGCWQ